MTAVLAISTGLAVALAAAILVVALIPVQLFGRWLIRKGRTIEEGKRHEAAPEHEDPFGRL
ncbi:MAG: hypothetical protein ACLQBB_00655 [Solirubrobacteraceae bacterium]